MVTSPDVTALMKCVICQQEIPLGRLKSHLASIHAAYKCHRCMECSFISLESREMQFHADETRHQALLNSVGSHNMLIDC